METQQNNEGTIQIENRDEVVQEFQRLMESAQTGNHEAAQDNLGFPNLPLEEMPSGYFHPMIDYRMIPSTRRYNK